MTPRVGPLSNIPTLVISPNHRNFISQKRHFVSANLDNAIRTRDRLLKILAVLESDRDNLIANARFRAGEAVRGTRGQGLPCGPYAPIMAQSNGQVGAKIPAKC